jgi:hypothetical protein
MDMNLRSIPSKAWTRPFVAGLYLLLLAPVPALATYTLGFWNQVSGPDTLGGITGSGLDLALTSVGGGVSNGTTESFIFVAQVTGSSSNASATTSNFNTFSVSSSGQTSGLQVTIGFSTSNTGSPISAQIYQNNNQFNQGTLPSSLPGTYNSVSVSDGQYAVVEFLFSSASGTTTTWGPTVSSSPVHITFSGS